MKPVHIGLMVAAAAFAGALVMKIMQEPPAPAEPAPVAAAQPEPAAELPMAEPVEPEPTPFPEKRQVKAEPQRQAPARPRQVAERRPAPVAEPPRPAPAAQPAEPAPAPEPEPAPAPAAEPAAVMQPRPAAPLPPPPPPPPRQVTIAAGTLLSARLVEALASDRNQPGDTFTATLDQPLAVDGLVIAERGARLEGRVVDLKQSGRVRGVAALGIALTRLRTSDGQNVAITTDTFTKEAPTSVGEDVKRGAAATGIGAAIGAIAGGGKGAAIGAAIGAAAGAGTAVATRGKPATLASETRINFRLSEPVTITEKR